MRCPSSHCDAIRCNQLLDVAEDLIDKQGVVSFRFAQIAKGAECSTNTLYKYFESKEDVLVCLFLRNTISSQIPTFIKENPDLTINERSVLAILFTFEVVKRSPIFNILRVVSINSMFWQLASSDKIEVLKNRVNLFWSRIKRPLEDAVVSGDLQATETDIKDLSQALYFFLAGITSSFESKLMDEQYFTAEDMLGHRHISRLMNRYQWRKPISQEMMLGLSSRICDFLDKGHGNIRSCENCLAIGKKSDCRE
ncbi:TetR/AcrR family transcriptional regulator [Shewanella sp. Choline-02u-19]|jgi:AcrR family transcriptional regulator|uniref:TetR/AcrR family transcriptional regulator n=1 Tax=unclassified Shewanella TaxID=196818 RepID=UPI000C338C80|nr:MULTISPECIES: TetR/AcrR family transcriptional regulator [unclassified Shewanella]PKG57145.1 TetR/AcrR family transcriptional regulator [Shewanella sp. GutDb-MelDb]PKG75237.1 TetR/AcrR family transcriptional regulator [Shewanella sp. GutCb]PKI29170.1 TetR/AcrR family transcriptional regulator [Shewanella sp. Choline-02u-19]